MTTEQGVFTTVAQVRPGALDGLREVLRGLGSAAEIASGVRVLQAPPPARLEVRFQAIGTMHYLRWVVLPAAADAEGEPIPAQLLLATCYDGTLGEHLEELVRLCWPAIADVYEHCVGYAAGDDRRELIAYLRAGDIGAAAWYVGSVGRSLLTIRREAELRQKLESFLDSRGWDGLSASEARNLVQEHVQADPDLRWALSPESRRSGLETARRYGTLAAGLARVIGVWPGVPLAAGAVASRRLRLSRPGAAALTVGLTVATIAAWATRLRYHETRDRQIEQLSPDEQHVTEVELEEDWGQQNQFTKLVNVKPGPFRQFTLRAVLFLNGLACQYVFTKGELLGIRTIHFASWSFLDGGRRLLFLSNFDGSWENYLSEFIDCSGEGLTAIYSNTAMFPRSRWLIFGGTQDEQRYKALVRNAQLTTQVWYRAYDRQTVVNVNSNSELRAGLWQPMDETEAQAWLDRL